MITAAPPTAPATGTVDVCKTILLAPRTRTSGCSSRRTRTGAARPAPTTELTTAVICSSTFRTGTIRDVPQSEKFDVEREYGLPRGSRQHARDRPHRRLELGGSNDIANLYPEKATPPGGAPGFHVKDRLENRSTTWSAPARSAAGRAAAIAGNWQALYMDVFGVAP